MRFDEKHMEWLASVLAEAGEFEIMPRFRRLGEGDIREKTSPADLVTASASGLDPDISPAAAAYQIARVAKARNMTPEAVQALVARHTSGRQWGVFGEPRVNVLRLNMALDESARGGVR